MESIMNEFILEVNKLDHVFQMERDKHEITMLEFASLDANLTDRERELYLREASEGFITTLKKTIEELIRSIGILIQKIIYKLTGDDAARKKLEAMLVADVSRVNERVEVYHTEAAREQLDMYIREMAKLERKLLEVKFAARQDRKHPGQYSIEAQEIFREMDKLEARYNPRLLSENSGVVKLALKDAIRFSLRQLDEVQVDYKAVEKNSKEVLTRFQRDANGCTQSIQASMLETMSMRISGKVREYVVYRTQSHTKTIAATLAVIAAGLAAKKIITAVTGEVAKQVYKDQYARNPNVKNAVDGFVGLISNNIPGTV